MQEQSQYGKEKLKTKQGGLTIAFIVIILAFILILWGLSAAGCSVHGGLYLNGGCNAVRSGEGICNRP